MRDPVPLERDHGLGANRPELSVHAILAAREHLLVASAERANAAFPDPGSALLEALIGLIEARASWEWEHLRTLAALAAHESAAQEVNAPTLPHPDVGPWLSERHAAVRDALTKPRLATTHFDRLDDEVAAFVAHWVRRIEFARHRRDPGRSRLAAAG